MTDSFVRLWVYLAADPLLWLTLTLVAYGIGRIIAEKAGGHPAANPVLIAVLLLVGVLFAAKVPYGSYFAGAQFVHFLLGTATVSLALPLLRQIDSLRKHLGPLMLAICAGSLVSTVSAIGIAWALGASRETILSLAPKSVTAPIAMGISEQIGGLPSLTAVLVILTGATGAILATWTLNLIGVKDWRARGLAVGTVAHGIGTARAFQVSDVAGAFAGLAMGVNGLLTAIVFPLALKLF